MFCVVYVIICIIVSQFCCFSCPFLCLLFLNDFSIYCPFCRRFLFCSSDDYSVPVWKFDLIYSVLFWFGIVRLVWPNMVELVRSGLVCSFCFVTFCPVLLKVWFGWVLFVHFMLHSVLFCLRFDWFWFSIILFIFFNPLKTKERMVWSISKWILKASKQK